MQTQFARQLAADLTDYHADQLNSGDHVVRDAIVVKIVALLVLAFNIPATSNGEVDIEEALETLRASLSIISKCRQ